jgi:hypothetical protein
LLSQEFSDNKASMGQLSPLNREITDPDQECRLLPEIIARGFLPNTADFNRISSVWAKCRYWQDIRSLEFEILHRHLICFFLIPHADRSAQSRMNIYQ